MHLYESLRSVTNHLVFDDLGMGCHNDSHKQEQQLAVHHSKLLLQKQKHSCELDDHHLSELDFYLVLTR